MPKGNNFKFKLTMLKEIMLKKTDQKHFITMDGIIRELEKEDIAAERKAIYRDLMDLNVMGISVEGLRDGRSYKYHVVKKEFELAELKLLVDAVQASRFVSEERSRQLIEKLETFASEYERSQLNRYVFVHGRAKTVNEEIYKNVDMIHNAILNGRKIRFRYGQWNIGLKMELRKNGQWYLVSPWYLAWNEGNYYLIGYDSEEGKVKHYRVDKMIGVVLTDEIRDGRKCFEQFNLAEYCKKNVSMYDGREETVTVRIENDMIGVFVDRYGKDGIRPMKVDENHSEIRFEVKVSDQFLGWIFALGDGVELMGPASVVMDARRMVERLKEKYG